ncbi:MAG: hypothetical protein V4667_06265 [Bacteroidota bacterium]
MRVIGEINHPSCKISIFYMNQKYIVKVEKDTYEQTYKLSEFDYLIKDVEDLKKLINEDFIQKCLNSFIKMRETNNIAFESISLG